MYKSLTNIGVSALDKTFKQNLHKNIDQIYQSLINFKTVKKYRKHENIKNPASSYSTVLLHLYYRMKTEKDTRN